MHTYLRTLLSMGLLFSGNVAVSSSLPGITVSPGGLAESSQISDDCPTFSWGQFTGAQSYEVVVFESGAGEHDDYQSYIESSQPAVQVQIAAPALSWTPASDQCLEPGRHYVWFVRAAGVEGKGSWSQGRKFEVDPNNSLLEETVRQEVASQLSEPATWRRLIHSVLQAEPEAALLLSQAGTRSGATVGNPAAAAGPVIHDVGADNATRNAVRQAASFVNPSAFRISAPDGVVFDDPTFALLGNSGSGSIPAEGEGARFMWYPRKAALRAGFIQDTQWDEANIGHYSMAFGKDVTASGFSSVAMGAESFANRNFSIAMGVGTTADGHSSKTLGSHTHASSYREIVIGSANTIVAPIARAIWMEKDRLFVIGNGVDINSRSDALVMLKNGNTGIGTSTPDFRLQVDDGSDCKVSGGGFIVAGDVNRANICIDDNEIMARNAAGTSALNLNFNGGTTKVGGDLLIKLLGSGGSTDVCRNGLDILSTCSSSGRYKEAIAPLSLGLDIVQRLKPVSFKWKDHDGRDLGFVAEAVAEIDPLLVTYNEDGQVEGVKYKQLTAVLVNALQAQQNQIGMQREMAERDRLQLAVLQNELAGYRTLMKEVRQLQVELKQLRQNASRVSQGLQLVTAD